MGWRTTATSGRFEAGWTVALTSSCVGRTRNYWSRRLERWRSVARALTLSCRPTPREESHPMVIEVKGRNLPVTDELREAVERRFEKVSKQVSELATLEVE